MEQGAVLTVFRIHEKELAVVCPVIDVIDWNTFEYLGNAGEPQIGGFDWRLVFTWHVVPERERIRMRSPIDVIRSGVDFSERAFSEHASGQLVSEGPQEGWLAVASPFFFQSICLLLLKIIAIYVDFILVYIYIFF